MICFILVTAMNQHIAVLRADYIVSASQIMIEGESIRRTRVQLLADKTLDVIETPRDIQQLATQCPSGKTIPLIITRPK